MAAWNYLSLDARGRKRKGVLEGDSARQVRQKLRDKGLAPLQVSRAAQQDTARSTRSPVAWLSPGLSVAERALITRQLSTLVAAGLPLEEALRVVAEQSGPRRLTSLVLGVRSHILEGYSLAQGLAQFPRAFNEQYRATVEAGEQSGRLAVVLERLADYVERQEQTRRKIRMAAIYPVVLLCVAMGIIVFLLRSIVPRITEVYAGSSQSLPNITEVLLTVSTGLGNFGLPFLLTLLVGVLAGRQALRHPGRRARAQSILLRVPGLGGFLRGFATARYAGTVALLTASSVPLVDAMRIAASVVSVLPVRSALVRATDQVREGGALSKALADSGFFSPMTIHMVASGEASGRLDELLERAARQEESRLSDLIDVGLGLLEPLLLVVMGLVVLLIITAVILPLTQMSTMI